MNPHLQQLIGFGITAGSVFVALYISPVGGIFVAFIGFYIFMTGTDKILFPEKQQP